MPLVRVELFERRLTPELESRLIDRLTDDAARDAGGTRAARAHLGDRGGPRRPPLGPRREALGRGLGPRGNPGSGSAAPANLIARSAIEIRAFEAPSAVQTSAGVRNRTSSTGLRRRPPPPTPVRAAASYGRSASRARSCRARSAPANRAAERVARRVARRSGGTSERQRGRHPEELEVVERLAVGAVDQRRALRLQPDRDPGAREERSVVADRRDIRRAADADDARLGTLPRVCPRTSAASTSRARARRSSPTAPHRTPGRRRRRPRPPRAALGRPRRGQPRPPCQARARAASRRSRAASCRRRSQRSPSSR